jgi:hypothetical protein
LLTFLIHLTVDLDVSAQTHGVCAGRLWLIRERYRALLADLVDGTLDLDAARRGRDTLMTEMHAIYERAALVDHESYRSTVQPVATLDDVPLSDEEIDQMLPKSLQRAGKSAA